MKNVIGSKSRLSGNLFLIEETLTDGSLVYNVTLENDIADQLAVWYCQSEAEALTLFGAMSKTYFEIAGTVAIDFNSNETV